MVSDEKVNSSTPFRLVIPRPLYSEMVAQAVDEAPLECCGVFAGIVVEGVGRVVARYPLANAAASPTEYESDGRAMFDAWRDMRERGIDVLAVYHSHPTSPPVPSRTDLARNYSEGVVNLIIGLHAVQPDVRGWWLTREEYREAEWEVVDN
jgi:proteasome lid subunit RPN8/RPN11